MVRLLVLPIEMSVPIFSFIGLNAAKIDLNKVYSVYNYNNTQRSLDLPPNGTGSDARRDRYMKICSAPAPPRRDGEASWGIGADLYSNTRIGAIYLDSNLNLTLK